MTIRYRRNGIIELLKEYDNMSMYKILSRNNLDKRCSIYNLKRLKSRKVNMNSIYYQIKQGV